MLELFSPEYVREMVGVKTIPECGTCRFKYSYDQGEYGFNQKKFPYAQVNLENAEKLFDVPEIRCCGDINSTFYIHYMSEYLTSIYQIELFQKLSYRADMQKMLLADEVIDIKRVDINKDHIRMAPHKFREMVKKNKDVPEIYEYIRQKRYLDTIWTNWKIRTLQWEFPNDVFIESDQDF